MPTQMLLIKDVPDLGRSGDLVKVKPGYARNFLLPRGLGIVPDKNALRMRETLQEERRKRAEEDRKESEKVAATVEGKTLTIKAKVDPAGHMYGSVTANDIHKLVVEEWEATPVKKGVQLKQPIKQTGVYSIPLVFPEGVTATVTVKVVSEGGVVQAEAEEKTEAEEATEVEKATEEEAPAEE